MPTDRVTLEQLEQATRELAALGNVDERCIDYTYDEDGQTAILVPDAKTVYPDTVQGVRVLPRKSEPRRGE